MTAIRNQMMNRVSIKSAEFNCSIHTSALGGGWSPAEIPKIKLPMTQKSWVPEHIPRNYCCSNYKKKLDASESSGRSGEEETEVVANSDFKVNYFQSPTDYKKTTEREVTKMLFW